jgi:hypothetical protein
MSVRRARSARLAVPELSRVTALLGDGPFDYAYMVGGTHTAACVKSFNSGNRPAAERSARRGGMTAVTDSGGVLCQ